MTEQYDLSDTEILQNFEDVGRCPMRLWRLAVAHTSRAEMHKGIISNKDASQFDIQDRL